MKQLPQPGGDSLMPAPLTIAYFSSSPGGLLSFEKWLTWRGIADSARRLGANLVYVAGEEFGSHPQAVLYDLIGRHNADGIIVWNAFVSQHSSRSKTQEFVDLFRPLPVVSMELALEGCLNLTIDNTRAVRDLLAHLIDGHGYRRVAFLGQLTNHASLERETAFVSIMEQYGLLDRRLIGTLEELDARGVAWGKECQAILAHSDEMAVAVVEAFRKRGLRVPQDVVVTGFNDGQEARSSIPPLTTARLPYRNLGDRAVEMLVGRIRGEPVPESVVLAPRLTLRRSCGCLEPMAEMAASLSTGSPLPAGAADLHTTGNVRRVFTHLRESLLPRMATSMGTSLENP